MPFGAIPYARQSVYQPNTRIADLLLARGDIAARNTERVAAPIMGTIGQILQARAEAPMLAAKAAEQRFRIENERAELAEHQATVQAQQQASVQRRALDDYLGSVPEGTEPDPRKIVSIVGPQAGAKVWADLQSFKPKPSEAPKTREIKVRNPDGTETTQIVEDKPGFTVTSTPEPPKVTYGSPEAVMIGGQRQLVRAGSDNKLYDMQGHVVTAAVTPDVPPSTARAERFWVVRNGQPIRVTDAEYRPGDLPANTREQGRPVTSGDAGKLVDINTSLNDLNTLTRDLGVTGNVSKLGAWTPNWVTNLTGWGADSKARQATIDRVKQVIGKALEGGVLRKEDEAKYEKILPTIGDEPSVAASKLQGLWNAITQKKQTQIDALADAGYDVTKFEARPPIGRTGASEATRKDGDEGTLNGRPVVWKTIGGQSGWVAK